MRHVSVPEFSNQSKRAQGFSVEVFFQDLLYFEPFWGGWILAVYYCSNRSLSLYISAVWIAGQSDTAGFYLLP